MRCSHCNSSRTLPAPAAYRAGRRQIPGSIAQALHPADASAAPAGRAARLAAPPRVHSHWPSLAGLCGAGLLFALCPLIGWIGAVLAGLVLVATLAAFARISTYNLEEYPASYRRWAHTRICLDCGRLYTPAEPVSPNIAPAAGMATISQ